MAAGRINQVHHVGESLIHTFCCNVCTRIVPTLTNTELIRRCQKQDVYKKSKNSLHVVWACTTSNHVRNFLVGSHSCAALRKQKLNESYEVSSTIPTLQRRMRHHQLRLKRVHTQSAYRSTSASIRFHFLQDERTMRNSRTPKSWPSRATVVAPGASFHSNGRSHSRHSSNPDSARLATCTRTASLAAALTVASTLHSFNCVMYLLHSLVSTPAVPSVFR